MAKASSNKLVIYNALSTILLYAITFFSAPLFSRLLGTENYGVVQVYNTWVSFFVVILGLYTRGTLSIAKVNLEEDEFMGYQSSVLFLSLCGFIIISILLLLFSPLVVPFFGLNIKYLILMLAQSFGFYCVYFINTKFTYEMKAKINLLISVSIALANFALSFLLIKILHAEHLYTGRIVGMAIPYIMSGIVILIYVFKQGKTFFNKKYWRFCLPLCLPLIFHGISGIICASSDKIMIQKMLGLTSVGIYALAYNFSNIMDSIWGALHNSWDPFFFEFVKENKLNELKRRSGKYIRLFTCLAVGFILLSPEVYQIFASTEYQDGCIIIPVVVLSIYAIFVYAFAANYEFCFKRTDIVAIGSVIAGIANVALNFVLIICLGYFGAAVATLLSNIILAIVHIIFAKQLVKDKWVYDIRMFIPACLALVLAVIMYYCFYSVWVVRWFYAGLVGIYLLRGIVKDRAIF